MFRLPEQKSLKLTIQVHPYRGVTIVEILIVSTIIAVMAALSFPVYKIIQQREKERKLKEFLDKFRTAIHGCQGNSNNHKRIKKFHEGYKNYILQRGIDQINVANPDVSTRENAEKTFINNAITKGLAYPETIWHLTHLRLPHTVVIATGPAPSDTVSIDVDHPFLRGIPPNPFKDWYPAATWTFTYYDTINSTGVLDIHSSGAGIALNGENTDDW